MKGFNRLASVIASLFIPTAVFA
ncbi:MAG: hypothetical protein RL326_1256, partial [Pseudomonadota bacterium]